MATQVQLRRGTTAENDAFTGAQAEVTVDLTKDNLRVHDGSTAGGFEIAKADSQTHTNVDINSGSIDGVTLGTNSAVTEAQVDNININGNTISSTDTNGNIAITPNGTGEVDISKVDIDSGTIDGVTIGGASAGAGTFTTLGATGDVSIADKIVHTGDTNTAIRFPAGDTVTVETAGSEAMRIDSNGTLLVGTTANIFNAKMNLRFSGSGTDNNGISIMNLGGVGENFMTFINSGGGGIGTISQNSASTVNYGTSSDYRLKEDVVPMSDSIARVKALNPVNFAWKIDGTRVDGFIAHEAQEVVPESVTGEKDAVETVNVYDEDGNVTGQEVRPKYQNIDQSKLVPLLTGAIKELIAEVETLKAEVATLKGN